MKRLTPGEVAILRHAGSVMFDFCFSMSCKDALSDEIRRAADRGWEGWRKAREILDTAAKPKRKK